LQVNVAFLGGESRRLVYCVIPDTVFGTEHIALTCIVQNA